MRLTLEMGEVGRIAIIRCKGRIIGGPEAQLLHDQIADLLRTRKAVVLNLAEVEFVDSSGLGTMVRALNSARLLHGDVKLCHVPAATYNVLKMTHLHKLFDIQDSEEHAAAAFARLTASFEKLKTTGPSVLCIDSNPDVLAYLKELLRRSGYRAYTSTSLEDSLIVMRLSPPGLLLVGPDLAASPETQQAFRLASAKVPVIELGSEFCIQGAGDAASELLAKIGARLHPQPELPS